MVDLLGSVRGSLPTHPLRFKISLNTLNVSYTYKVASTVFRHYNNNINILWARIRTLHIMPTQYTIRFALNLPRYIAQY